MFNQYLMYMYIPFSWGKVILLILFLMKFYLAKFQLSLKKRVQIKKGVVLLPKARSSASAF